MAVKMCRTIKQVYVSEITAETYRYYFFCGQIIDLYTYVCMYVCMYISLYYSLLLASCASYAICQSVEGVFIGRQNVVAVIHPSVLSGERTRQSETSFGTSNDQLCIKQRRPWCPPYSNHVSHGICDEIPTACLPNARLRTFRWRQHEDMTDRTTEHRHKWYGINRLN